METKLEDDFDVKILLECFQKAEFVAQKKKITDASLIKDIAVTFFIQKMNFINRRNSR